MSATRSATLTSPASLLAILAAGAVITACAGARAETPAKGERPYVVAASPEEAGAYLVRAGSCDDCHTPGWPESGGTIPDQDRLAGSPVGFRGPWGTTYPANLRLSASKLEARDWVAMIRARNDRPPMPWFSLHAMSDRDLTAIHAFLRKLGPKGQPALPAVAPDREPTTPYILFAPVPPKAASASNTPARAPASADANPAIVGGHMAMAIP
ncbi:MAG: hypothetical protein SFV24_05020 [Gemmatimonadales bacterium]|nr:hypothetical protein [Gemmatimonadales bacterium]